MARVYSDAELDAMAAAAEAERRATPHGRAVTYERATRTFVLDLLAGGQLRFAADAVRELAGANEDQLAEVVLTPSGNALGWESLDVDIAVTGLVLDLVAGEGWRTAFRQLLMREITTAKSPRKARAARENGKKGGRPRKLG